MINKRYGIPFVAALVLNLAYWGVVGNWFGHLKPPETPKKDLVINLDMGQQEPPEAKKPEELKTQPDDKPVAGGGKAGSVLPDLSGKPTEGLKNLNPYLGGNEPAPVNLNGNNNDPVGHPGAGNVPGLNNGPTGHNRSSVDGTGSVDGPPGPGETKRDDGIFDDSGYRASLNANKVMPAQAVRRGITGTVTIRVYFDGEGNYISAEIEHSSGSSLLDNDALALAARSGGATNTTGEPKSDVYYIRYELE
jgi:TonB family protein